LELNDDCEQAIQLCTTTRAKKVVVGQTLVALIAQTIDYVCWTLYDIRIINFIYFVVFHIVVPVIVLIINVIVVREVRRRASSDAASNLGLQHHQSASSNSAVPTVMLVTTSLVYVLLYGVWSFFYLAHYLNFTWALHQYLMIAQALSRFIYAYNFYVYLITGKQFRADLLTFICCCRRSSSSSSPPPPAAAAANANVRVARRDQADTAV